MQDRGEPGPAAGDPYELLASSVAAPNCSGDNDLLTEPILQGNISVKPGVTG